MVTKTTIVSPGVSYVEWSSVIAGTILALAISIIFLQFGAMLGLNVFEPTQSGATTRGMVITAAAWLFWVQLVSSLAGGYTAGRMRAVLPEIATSESEVRDGAHGLLVWALGTILAVIAAAVGSFFASIGGDLSPAVERHQEIAEHLTKNTAIVFGFVAAAGSFVSAAASCWAAIAGGRQRNEMLEFRIFTRSTTRSR